MEGIADETKGTHLRVYPGEVRVLARGPVQGAHRLWGAGDCGGARHPAQQCLEGTQRATAPGQDREVLGAAGALL